MNIELQEPAFLRQTALLIYKNLLMRWISKTRTFLEFAIPLFFVGLLLAVYYLVTSSSAQYGYGDEIQFEDLSGFSGFLWVISRNESSSALAQQIVNTAAQNAKFGVKAGAVVRTGTEDDLKATCDGVKKSAQPCFAAVIFDDIQLQSSSPINYTIRMPQDQVPDTESASGPSTVVSTRAEMLYISSGFAALQTHIDQALVAAKFPQKSPAFSSPQSSIAFSSTIKADVDAARRASAYNGFLRVGSSAFIIFAFLGMVYTFMSDLTFEKETRLLEGMKMMGLKDSAYYISWILSSIIVLLPPLILVILILKETIMTYSSFGVVFFFYLSFGISLISLCFLLSIVPIGSNVAGLMSTGSVLVFLAIGIVLITLNDRSPIGYGVQIFSSFLSPVSFSWGQLIITMREKDEIGVSTFSDASDSVGGNFGTYLLMIWVDTALYSLLAWYLGNLFPGQFGTPKKWNFFVEFFRSDVGTGLLEPLVGGDFDNGTIALEEEDAQHPVGIEVAGITKVYDTSVGKTTAVKNLSLTAYKNQVLSLLGHNGAGKSSLMAMLTGLYKPTSGNAKIAGFSIVTEMSKIRKNIGVCPQHDVLWLDLSVRQTLTIFAGLKGVPFASIAGAVEDMITRLGLGAKGDVGAGTLSGGQKRKLSIAIALIGNSQVVFFDEPTSGMDPFSRRAVWDVIEASRAGRCTVLTTHFLDEADLLGDRVAVMSKGQVRAAGSSLFLKSRFGIGYTLTIVMEEGRGGSSCDVLDLVNGNIENCRSVSNTSTEIVMQLPLASAPLFPTLFRQIDSDKSRLGVVTYGVSMTTLEDVFLRISDENKMDADARLEENKRLGVSYAERLRMSVDFSTRMDADEAPSAAKKDSDHWDKFFIQMKSLLLKRWWSFKRSPYITLGLLIIFLGIVVLGCFVGKDIDASSCGTTPIPLAPLTLSYNNLFAQQFPSLIFSPNSSGVLTNMNLTAVDVPNPTTLENTILANLNRFVGGAQTCCGANIGIPSVIWDADLVHSLPSMINLLDSAILQQTESTQPLSDPPTIITTSHPFTAINFLSGAAAAKFQSLLYMGFILIIAFPILPAATSIFIVRERTLNVKHQQLVSGVSGSTYWLSHLLWDSLIHLVCMALCVLFFGVISATRDAFWKPETGGIFFVILMLYSIASTLMSYALSFGYKTPGMCFGSIMGMNIGISFLYLVALINVLVQQLLSSSIPFIAVIAINAAFFTANPLSAVIWSVLVIGNVGGVRCQYDPAGGPPTQIELLGLPLIILIAQIFILWAVLLLRENADAIKEKIAGTSDGWSPSDDEGGGDANVQREEAEVCQGRRDDALVVVKNLRKEYPPSFGKIKVAVKNMSFSVSAGTCFGCLGPNGAGKTSTLRMLVGDESATYGTAIIAHHSIRNNLAAVRRNVGFCPQFDALLPDLTTREHLWLYGRLRGIKDIELGATIMSLLKKLDLENHADKLSGGLSGGNKRKLSLAIALLGDPKVLFLDEPSTGMDPAAKRFMWDVINSIKPGRAIILTTHSMDEADSLCDTIGIMVDGRLKCLSSSQQLKSDYGKGYQLEIKTSPARIETCDQFVRSRFPGVEEKERRGNLLRYEIPTSKMDLATIFETVETSRAEGAIVEYSVSQTTLEQIFLHFGKLQLAAMGLDDYGESSSLGMFHLEPSGLNIFLNILYCLFVGFLPALWAFFAGAFFAFGVITLPFAKMAFRVGFMMITPYGRNLNAAAPQIENKNANRLIMLFNLLWVPVGLILAIFEIMVGGLLLLTIIGIPFALVHFKMATKVLFPFGKQKPAFFCCGRPEEGHPLTPLNYIF